MLTTGTSAEANPTARRPRTSARGPGTGCYCACGSGGAGEGEALTNVLTTSPLGLPQYCQMPCCLLGSAGSPPADQWVSAMWAPLGNAGPSLLVHGSAMNLSLSFWPSNFFAIALTEESSSPFFATVSSYQSRL